MNNRSVYLRAFEPEDYKLINKWRNDFEIQSLTCGHFRYVSTIMEKSWTENLMLNNKENVYLSIILNDGSDKMIGYTSINNINHIDRKAHGGGIVIGDKETRGADILTDTFILLFQHAFDDLNLHRLTGACLEEHTDSRLMMETMGMKMEGIEYDSICKLGKYHNVCKYAILSNDYYRMTNNGDFSMKSFLQRYKQAKSNLKRI